MAKRLLIALLLLLPGLAAAATATADTVIYTREGERVLKLELATTPAQREHGLMDRRELKPSDGMLFIFPAEGNHAFWMKNTPLPLDMLFVDKTQTIVHIESNATPFTLTPHAPGQPVLSVIELDAGRAARESIAEGDKVRYDLPNHQDVY